MALSSCSSCAGLVPARATRCPHCEAAIEPPRSGLRAVLANLGRVAVGGVALMTLMACYGGPAYIDDCVDQDDDGWFPACYAVPCDPAIDPNCDCNDAAPDIFPGALDTLGDGIDQDCSGADGPGQHRPDAAVDASDAVDAGDDAAEDAAEASDDAAPDAN